MTPKQSKDVDSSLPDFGDYCHIEMFRHGAPNEMYQFKVVNNMKSNGWVDVPVKYPVEETLHDEIVPVVSAIQAGVREVHVLKFRVTDLVAADGEVK